MGTPFEARASNAAIASRRAAARMWLYRRNMAVLTSPIISSMVASGTPASAGLAQNECRRSCNLHFALATAQPVSHAF